MGRGAFSFFSFRWIKDSLISVFHTIMNTGLERFLGFFFGEEPDSFCTGTKTMPDRASFHT